MAIFVSALTQAIVFIVMATNIKQTGTMARISKPSLTGKNFGSANQAASPTADQFMTQDFVTSTAAPLASVAINVWGIVRFIIIAAI